MQIIDAQELGYRELNAKVREIYQSGETQLKLVNVNGHRYIASGLSGELELEIEGTGGNDLAAYMAGPRIIVNGNVQDCIANTMNSGFLAISGRAGDILGYGMSGGTIYIRGDVGSRAGIHIKASGTNPPALIIGGTAGDFLGEYMAGGTIIVLGLEKEGPVTGRQCGVGMYGGVIYVNKSRFQGDLGPGAQTAAMETEDNKLIEFYLAGFAEQFGLELAELQAMEFVKIVPKGERPYKTMYAGV
ncbi:MAG: hypothetical protein ACM3QZ_09055 [Solirubrobacterales bacterium]